MFGGKLSVRKASPLHFSILGSEFLFCHNLWKLINIKRKHLFYVVQHIFRESTYLCRGIKTKRIRLGFNY